MLLQVKSIHKEFFSSAAGHVRAVDGVSLDVQDGESLGIVGESGCGKTTLARIIMGLLRPDRGEILFQGEAVWGRPEREYLFRRRVRMVFQDPYASLDPRFSVEHILQEALCLERERRASGKKERMVNVLRSVGLEGSVLSRFPHEFSGGERQRISIARALMTEPLLLILDEAVSALDVLIQKEILDLLLSLQERRAFTQIFISHNLGAIRKIAKKIVVMYRGRIVEYGTLEQIFRDPQHPYTRRLLEAALQYRVLGAGEMNWDEQACLKDVGQGHLVLV